MTSLHVRNVVLGAGAVGSAAAYHLARRGEPVLLIEQFALGHDRGSSHGEGRITRHSYADARYARLMPAAFREWRRLEADAGRALYLRTGGASLAPPGDPYAEQVAASLEAIACPHSRMTGREWNALRPEFAVEDDFDVVYEPDAGVLLADKILKAEVSLARHLGGNRTEVWENDPVERIDLEGDRPALLTAKGRVTTDRLILAAGPWTGRLVSRLAPLLRIERQQVLYVRPGDPGAFTHGRFPVFIVRGGPGREFHYGMPSLFGGDVKVARDGGAEVDAEADDRTVGPAYIAEVRDFLRGTLPALADAPVVRTEVCKYTMAPANDFLVDRLDGRPDVVLASPCSGHGFKFSILVGRVLADLAVDGETEIDRDLWRLPELVTP